LHLDPALIPWPTARVDVRSAVSVAAAFEADRPGVVINCAAWTDVDAAESRPDEAFAVNAAGAAHLAEACDRHGARMLQVSTDYVFDGSKSSPWTEQDPVGPLGVYGASKLEGERAVAAHCRDHAIVRTAWLYGPWSRRSFVDTMLRLTAERPSVDAVADVTGSPTLTFDLARALLFLARHTFRGTLHAANTGVTSWHGIAAEIVRLTARTCEVRPVPQTAFPRPARRPANSALDSSRLREIGHPMRPWGEALADHVGRQSRR
ncbi:MAG: dTDP-4-dehydrorhamnose reductase, partial [Candidatus Brocadiae bacterium]|nr:dTDP-4-dehydrorhamnose reductase [Candidatus Brocadiia bacterium]